MVDAILLVLREVLEAALIISLLLALSRKLTINQRWLVSALLLGVASSWMLAHFAYGIAEAVEGTGQEWLNALLYLMVIIAFIFIAFAIAPLLFNTSNHILHCDFSIAVKNPPIALLTYSCLLTVGLSLAREVAEVWIYLSGFIHQPALLQSALTGGAIGVGIGISLGVITYYLLIFISLRLFLHIFFVLLIFLCGGLAMQIAKQLLQIGVLDSTAPLWDSSNLVSEHSWLGELLYALIGYDASPSAAHVIFYGLAITPLLLILAWNWHHRNHQHA